MLKAVKEVTAALKLQKCKRIRDSGIGNPKREPHSGPSPWSGVRTLIF